MCLRDAISADEALLFSLRRNFLLGQHEQTVQHSSSLLILFDELKKSVLYLTDDQWFAFNYFEQNELVGCLNSKTTPSWATQQGVNLISGRWKQPWGTSGLISLDPGRLIWLFVLIHMHDFSRHSQWQKKKVAKSTIFHPHDWSWGVKVISVLHHITVCHLLVTLELGNLAKRWHLTLHAGYTEAMWATGLKEVTSAPRLIAVRVAWGGKKRYQILGKIYMK